MTEYAFCNRQWIPLTALFTIHVRHWVAIGRHYKLRILGPTIIVFLHQFLPLYPLTIHPNELLLSQNRQEVYCREIKR
jgi:hypothetical protein